MKSRINKYQINDVNVTRGYNKVDFLNAQVTLEIDCILGWSYDRKNENRIQYSGGTMHAAVETIERQIREAAEKIAKAKLGEIASNLRDKHPDWPEEYIEEYSLLGEIASNLRDKHPDWPEEYIEEYSLKELGRRFA